MKANQVYAESDFAKLNKEVRRRAQAVYEARLSKRKDEYSKKEQIKHKITILEAMLINKERMFDSELIFIEMMALTDDYLTQTSSI